MNILDRYDARPAILAMDRRTFHRALSRMRFDSLADAGGAGLTADHLRYAIRRFVDG